LLSHKLSGAMLNQLKEKPKCVVELLFLHYKMCCVFNHHGLQLGVLKNRSIEKIEKIEEKLTKNTEMRRKTY